MMYANSAPVTVSTGITSTFGFPMTDSPGIMMLDDGSHPRVDDSISINTTPVTNSGREIVTRPPIVRNLSILVSARVPTHTPITRPSGTAITKAEHREQRGMGQPFAPDLRYRSVGLRRLTEVATHRIPDPVQVPDVWRTVEAICARRFRRLSGVACCPCMTDAASPGTASISVKIATDTASSVTTMRESLTIRNLAI